MTRDLLTAADADPSVRFTASPDFALPLGDLRSRDANVLATGLGLLGADSPLPLALADDLAAHPSAILDDLHHRRVATLVAARRAADLARNLDGADPWSRRISALVGLTDLSPGTSPLTRLRLAPIFAAPDRGLRGLARLLHRLFGRTGPAPALRCEPRPAVLTPLHPSQHTRLGASAARLGATAALGTAVRLPSTSARLFLGPLPAGLALADVRAAIAAYLPEPLDLDLVVDAPPTPPILGRFHLGRA